MFLPIIRNKRRKALFLVSACLIVFHRSISYSVIPETEFEMAAEPEVIESVTNSAAIVLRHKNPAVSERPDQRAIELDKIVQPITTVTEFVGGQQERNRGSGFVIGNRFFTVNHNLTTAFPSLRVRSTTFIDGMSVTQPVFTSEEEDVAVFDLPDKICAKYCNTTEVAYSPTLQTSRRVYWLRKYQEEFVLKEASIIGSVAFGDTHQPAELSCSNNSVVLVDQPFIPGSSGSPIMDAESGEIIGIIQGSVDDGEKSNGYFKPINCVLAMLADSQSEPRTPHSLAKL